MNCVAGVVVMVSVSTFCLNAESHEIAAHAIHARRMVTGILPLIAPATPTGAQLYDAMCTRRWGNGGTQVEPQEESLKKLQH